MKTLFRKLFKLGIYADDTKGSVVVELALIMSVFALMMVGGYDFSRMAMESHKMEQVARAGTQWGLLGQANAIDVVEIERITREAAGDDSDVITVEIQSYCECPGGAAASCGDICVTGEVSLLFLDIRVTKPFVYLFRVPELFGDILLSGQSIVRVR